MATSEVEIDRLIADGVASYTARDFARALEAWMRVLDIDPGHARALQLVASVREILHVDHGGMADAPLPPLPAPTSLRHAPNHSAWGDVAAARGDVALAPLEIVERSPATRAVSVRFEEPHGPSPLSRPMAPILPPPPAQSQLAEVVRKDAQRVLFDEPRARPAFLGRVTARAHGAVNVASGSPWDDQGGAAHAINLDTDAHRVSPFQRLLSTRSQHNDGPPVSRAAERSGPIKLAPPLPSDDGDSPVRDVARDKREAECKALMAGASELFELGDFTGSLELVEKVLRIDPQNDGARAYLARNEDTLTKMYESKLGALEHAPRLLVPQDEVIWINLHHRAGFVLSQVDGMVTYEDLLALSSMPRFEALRILAELVGNGIIG